MELLEKVPSNILITFGKDKASHYSEQLYNNWVKIGIISTGGTIGSKAENSTCSIDADALDDTFDLLESLFPNDFIYRQPFNLFSEDIVPKHWFELAGAIIDIDIEDNCDGYLVLHGTDTMTYTANALSFILSVSGFHKPVVLTGSRLPSNEPDSDALQNLIDSTACLNYLKSGVVVLFGQPEETASLIYDPRYCRKDSSNRMYKSINIEPIGSISNRLLYRNKNYFENANQFVSKTEPLNGRRGLTLKDVIPEEIHWLKVYPGVSKNSLESLSDRVVLLEGYAAYTLPNDITDALGQSVPLIVLTVPDGTLGIPRNTYPSLEKLGKQVILSSDIPETVYVNAICAATLIQDKDDLLKFLQKSTRSYISFES